MESKKLYSSLDRMRDPKGAEWLPDASLIDSWTSLMSDEIAQGKASILQKNIATSDAKQPNLKLYLRLPSAAKSGKRCQWRDCLLHFGIQGIEHSGGPR